MKRKTKAEKIITGTYRSDRDVPPDSVPLTYGRLNEVPDPSDRLDEHAAEVFNEITGLLLIAGLLERADIRILEILSSEISRYWSNVRGLEAEGEIVTLPNGYKKKNERCQLVREILRGVTDLAAEFGLTVGARCKISMPAPTVKPFDPKIAYMMSLMQDVPTMSKADQKKYGVGDYDPEFIAQQKEQEKRKQEYDKRYNGASNNN